jgi:acetyl-CoA acetyltransferase
VLIWPSQEQVSFITATNVKYSRSNTDRSRLSYAVEACRRAIADSALDRSMVDGLIGMSCDLLEVQRNLGLPHLSFFGKSDPPFVSAISMAVGALVSGQCSVVLAFHAPYRLPWNTSSAYGDAFRSLDTEGVGIAPEALPGALAYASWASRYIAEYGVERESFATAAVQARASAGLNPNAVLRDPITVADYLASPMVSDPLCLYDLDVAVDGADAFILCRTDLARDLTSIPVAVHAVATGMEAQNLPMTTSSLSTTGQSLVVSLLRARCDYWIDDIDLYFPYDGFSIILYNWLEEVGFCGRGEAPSFMASAGEGPGKRPLINGRIAVNPHGGSLAEGASQGAGHVREAVHQLMGLCEERQVRNAQRALLTAGGFFHNAQGLMLSRVGDIESN